MKAVNLLPPDMRGTPARTTTAATPVVGVPVATSEGPGPYILLGALAAGVLMMAAYVLVGNTIKDREAELARVQQEQAATLARATALKPFADFQALATARVATVQALAASRFDWEQGLRDLARAVPREMRLTRLAGDLGGADAISSNPLRGAIAAPAFSLSGCTASHTDVAKLMSRLRNIRGVSRVSLASSVKEAPSAQGAAQPAVTESSTEGRLCRGTRVPTFEVVVFFGDSAATTAGTVPPATTASPAPGTTPAPAGAEPAPGSTSGAAGAGGVAAPADVDAQSGTGSGAPGTAPATPGGTP